MPKLQHPRHGATLLQYLSARDTVRDVTLLCSDGAVPGQKVVLAALSPMLHSVFCQHIWDEEVSLSIPDFTVDQISKYLDDVFHSTSLVEHPQINRMLGHQVSGGGSNKTYEKMESLEHKLELELEIESKLKREPAIINSFREEQSVVKKIAFSAPLLVEKVKLEEDIDDLIMIKEFDNELESLFDPNNAIIKSEDDFKHGEDEAEKLNDNPNIKVKNRNRRIEKGSKRKGIQCPEEGCMWKGVTKLHLEQHLKRIHVPLPPKVYECDQCEFKTTVKRNSIRHRKVHEGPTKDKPIPCEICGKMLTSNRMLTNHLLMEHGMSSKVPGNCTKCVKCKLIMEKDELESHVCIKKHKCKECGEMFYNESERIHHFAVKHSELLPTSNCEICGTIFRGIGASSSLKKHLKIHTEGEVECPQCGKKVRQLENHIATTHTENHEMKHKCSYCGKGFSNKTVLQNHIDSIHLDARKYPCRYGCSFRYNDFSNRNAHERKKHGALHSRSEKSRYGMNKEGINYETLC